MVIPFMIKYYYVLLQLYNIHPLCDKLRYIALNTLHTLYISCRRSQQAAINAASASVCYPEWCIEFYSIKHAAIK